MCVQHTLACDIDEQATLMPSQEWTQVLHLDASAMRSCQRGHRQAEQQAVMPLACSHCRASQALRT